MGFAGREMSHYIDNRVVDVGFINSVSSSCFLGHAMGEFYILHSLFACHCHCINFIDFFLAKKKLIDFFLFFLFLAKASIL